MLLTVLRSKRASRAFAECMHCVSIRRADLKQQNMLISTLLSSTQEHATCKEGQDLGHTTTSTPLSVILAKMKHN